MTERRYSLDFVIPCYQEEHALPLTVPLMLNLAESLLGRGEFGLGSFRIFLIDDGSTDRTWAMIDSFAANDPRIVGIRLSRNFGHQNAILAGLSRVTADACITLDADLQDDIGVVVTMLKAFEAGSDLALGVRNDRTSDSGLKRNTANFYYRVLSMLGAPVIENHADFRLMSKRAVEALLAHSEVNLFLRGIVPTLGFTTTLVPYARQARNAGETKYTPIKLLRLGVDGITSFSVVPLRLVAALGAMLFVFSVAVGLIMLAARVFTPQNTVPGWASTVLPLLFLSGMQLLSLGVLGEYLGKIYLEVKRRPRFIVQAATDEKAPPLSANPHP